MKTILLALLTAYSLFAATPEQIERYLSISNADEQLAELENEFSIMQENLRRYGGDGELESYDIQLLSIRFKAYLQKHLSEDEMDKILALYRNVLLLRFVSATAVNEEEITEEKQYLNTLPNFPDSEERIALVRKINEAMYTKESMGIMYDNLTKPLYERISGGKLNANSLKRERKAYIKRMQKETEGETLYATRDFTIEELESLLKLAEKPAIRKETRAVFEATAYALQAFFQAMAKRYDITTHQTNKTPEKP